MESIGRALPIFFVKRKGSSSLGFSHLYEEILSIKRFIKLVKTLKLDVIISISEWPVRYCYYLKLFSPKVKSVLWFQDVRTKEDLEKILTNPFEKESSTYLRSDFSSQFKIKLEHFFRKRGILSIDKCLTQADFIKEKIKKVYDIDTVRIELLSNPVKVPSSNVISKSKKPLVIFLGRLDAIKRPWLFGEIAKALPRIKFLVLGKAQSTENIEPLLEKYKGLSNLSFLGLVIGEEKYKILAKAWILVNTSIYESLPISFLEALAHKMAILSCQNPDGITSRYGYFTGEIFGDRYQIIEEFIKRLKWLLADNKWRILGEEGYDFVKNFSSREKIKERLNKILKELTAK